MCWGWWVVNWVWKWIGLLLLDSWCCALMSTVISNWILPTKEESQAQDASWMIWIACQLNDLNRMPVWWFESHASWMIWIACQLNDLNRMPVEWFESHVSWMIWFCYCSQVNFMSAQMLSTQAAKRALEGETSDSRNLSRLHFALYLWPIYPRVWASMHLPINDICDLSVELHTLLFYDGHIMYSWTHHGHIMYTSWAHHGHIMYTSWAHHVHIMYTSWAHHVHIMGTSCTHHGHIMGTCTHHGHIMYSSWAHTSCTSLIHLC